MPTETLIATGRDCAPPLSAKLAPWIQALTEQPGVARNWLNEWGSPVHVLVGSEFRRNVKDLLAPFQSRQLAGGLYFARKANKLKWFVKLAKDEGIGVDTASLTELKETLGLGLPPDRIIVTAVAKSKALVEHAVLHGCLLVLDNADEFAMVRSVSASSGRSARIGLRFAGFDAGKGNGTVFSRFGFPLGDSGQLLEQVRGDAGLRLEILHAHLDRYDIDERASAARSLLEVADGAAGQGLKLSGIDLGGGVLIRYLQDAQQWETFQKELFAAVAGERPSFTFRGDGLGLVKAKGSDEILGSVDLYPAFNQLSKERFISAVLDHERGGVPLHKELTRRSLKLFFEPGRALLDNAGITLATVAFRKRDTLGNLLVGMAMNRTHLRPFRAEFCIDPMLLPNPSLAAPSLPSAPVNGSAPAEGAYLVGNLCSESDLLYRRKLQLHRLPVPSDIFCFPNTAGYLAHHLEVGTHGDPLPVNLLIEPQTWKIVETSP